MKTTADQLEKALAWSNPKRHLLVLSPVDAAELEDIVPALIEDVQGLALVEARLAAAVSFLKRMRRLAGLDYKDCHKTTCGRCKVLREVDAFLAKKEIG